jgi:hypothetical protein
MAASAHDRSAQARAAVYQSWANTADPSARTAPARAAQLARFEKLVDPDGTLPPDERARLAAEARRGHYQHLARLSAESVRRSAPERTAERAQRLLEQLQAQLKAQLDGGAA